MIKALSKLAIRFNYSFKYKKLLVFNFKFNYSKIMDSANTDKTDKMLISTEDKSTKETNIKNNEKQTKNNKDNNKSNKNKQENVNNTNNKDKDTDSKTKGTAKIVKGARDFMPFQMSIRSKVFKIINDVFKKHGAVEIDTPVFELKETLIGKYGEDSKLIYDLQDQGGELLSLRYDLTVPFARFMAVHNLPSIKRYHIGKVYRRDTPNMNKGRYREFYQCDFDIAGPSYGKMIPDAEVLKVIVEILSELNLGNFLIKINHRKLLDATVELSGISNNKFTIVCSSVDKLDKEPWSVVRAELLSKGVTEEQADKLWSYVQYKDSPPKLLATLKNNEIMLSNTKAKEALEEMSILIEYLEILQITDKLSFDLSLARGLDYYTGLIFEAVLTEGDQIGSIAGGGRYDELLGMFSNKSIPAVGGSIGIERVFNILEEKLMVNKNIILSFRMKKV